MTFIIFSTKIDKIWKQQNEMKTELSGHKKPRFQTEDLFRAGRRPYNLVSPERTNISTVFVNCIATKKFQQDSPK
jgi:hypothetical protein